MPLSITRFAKNAVNLIYPLRCASCKISLDSMDEFGVCCTCIGSIRRNPKRSFAGVFFDRAYSACLYEETLKELIHTFKYKRKIYLSKLFTHLLAEYIKADPGIIDGVDIVTFVPLHNRRRREREFNQSSLLASGISDKFKIPLAVTLDKTKSTKNQNELSRYERLSNLDRAFSFRPGADIAGYSILVIDDVMTTGATLDECAKTLKAAGAREVRCLTLARGL